MEKNTKKEGVNIEKIALYILVFFLFGLNLFYSNIIKHQSHIIIDNKETINYLNENLDYMENSLNDLHEKSLKLNNQAKKMKEEIAPIIKDAKKLQDIKKVLAR